MKKSHTLLMLIILLCMIPLCTALAASGTVTVSALNIRAKASADSNVVGVLHQGDKVTIQETSGSWYKITGNGRTGYVARKHVSISSGSSSGSNTSKSSSSGGTCAPGDKGDAVRKVQNRLIALGYLPSGRPLTVESNYQDIASPYLPHAMKLLTQNALEMAKELEDGNSVS